MKNISWFENLPDQNIPVDTMMQQKLSLIDEQNSPLFRIMWVHNSDEPQRRQFENNACAFHIGNGLILSVAHNLRSESRFLKVISDEVYLSDIRPKLLLEQLALFNKCYPIDALAGKRYLSISNPEDMNSLIHLFKQIQFDTRWISLEKKNICNPFLIIQFRNNQFYNDNKFSKHFNDRNYFNEPALNRHTFLLKLELLEAFYADDLALYRIVETPAEIISRIPAIPVSYKLLDDDESNLYCLQSAPGNVMGRLLNTASIEGFLDHWNTFQDQPGGNYIIEGIRYLIKGYFRFGSSGAPYVVYDKTDKAFKVNAVQSEASPIQLSINNSQEGNFQYINAIASPLNNIEKSLEKFGVSS